MNENASKLEALRKEIEECSEKEAEAIVKNAERAAAEKIAELEKKIYAEREGNLRNITESFKTKEKNRISEVRFSEGRRVVLHRNKLVDEFFGKVEEKLLSALSEPKYKDYINNSIKLVNEKYPISETTVVSCKSSDLKLVTEALSGFTSNIAATSEIKIGGIILNYPEKNIIINMSLDAALEKEREEFVSLKEMQL